MPQNNHDVFLMNADQRKTTITLPLILWFSGNFKPFGGEGLSSIKRADGICTIFGTRRFVCKFWLCIGLVAVVIKFRGDVVWV